MCKQRVGLRIRRIKRNCSFQQLPSHRVVVLRARIDTGKRTHDTLPGVQAFRLLALCSYTLGSVKLRLNRCHYPLSYLVLKRKDAGEFPIIALGPDMMPGDGVNELRGDTHSVRLLANTTFKRVAHSQLTTYLLHVDHPALEVKLELRAKRSSPRSGRRSCSERAGQKLRACLGAAVQALTS